MAAEDPELQAVLRNLDRELEEGEITEKGYQKRRALIISRHLSPQADSHTNQRFSTAQPYGVTGGEYDPHREGPTAGARVKIPRPLNISNPDIIEPEEFPANLKSPVSESDRGGSAMSMRQVPQLSRIQEQELGFSIANSGRRQPSAGSYDSLFLPKGHLDPNESYDVSRSGTLTSQHYAFNPGEQAEYNAPTRNSTMLDSQQYFSDFAGEQPEATRDSYGMNTRYSQSEPFSPTVNIAPPPMPMGDMPLGTPINHLLPLEPRDIPFDVKDPHNSNLLMSTFENLPSVLRHRARTHPKQPAYWVLDQRGKEVVSITWEKLGSRAEKVAQVIRDKSNLYRGDRVALVYRDSELIEFAVALMGCFIAGVVAVPINNLEDYTSLNVILTSTQAHLALTTENNLKTFQRDITTQKLTWPRGVEWWKTNEFGSYHPKKKDDVPPLVVPDLAYIEFSRAPTGDLRGVVLSHRTIMHQMACLTAVISSVNTGSQKKNGAGEILMTYLDPRQGIGMILGVLLTVYGGHTTTWIEAHAIETPGLYASLITKFRATLLAADYTGLKHAVYNYQKDPMATRSFKKNVEPNFSTIKLCLIDTSAIDCEFHEVLADRWLRPLRNPRAREVVAPMLCLPEHGGMVISVRDWLGGEERMGCPLTHEVQNEKTEETPEAEKDSKKEEKPDEPKMTFGSSLIGGGTATPAAKMEHVSKNEPGEVLLDKEALKNNEIVVLAMGEEARKIAATTPNSVRVGAFGYPIADATLAIVDPETGLLCTPNVIGELWVDSPSLSGGFWALPKHTETIFHARPYKFQEGSPTPIILDLEFLRTGLLGCTIEGRIFVLGFYEDRLRQKVEWVEHGVEAAEHRYFFVQHLILDIMKNVPNIHDCSAFDVFVNEEYLPVVVLESYAASTAPITSGGPSRPLDIALLDSLAERCIEVLYQEHHLRVYCVMITAPNTLPRATKNGRQEIGNMLCRREFDNGSLPCVHVKFGVERSVLNLPLGADPAGGIWSPIASAARQDALMLQEKQYSGVDIRDVIMDDRTSTPLNNFPSIVDLLQWRVQRQAEELCYCSIDGRSREGKGITWKKFDTKVAAVAAHLKNKVKLRQGDHVILMYTHSEDYVFAVHACFCLGIVAIPVAPIDQNRLSEDAPALLHLIADFNVKAVIVNSEVNDLLKQKVISQHLRQSANVLRVAVPGIYNTAKPSKQSHGCRHLGFTLNEKIIKSNVPAMVWTYWTSDQRRLSVHIGHDTIMAMCKVQKETCQMSSSRPVLGCVRSTMGLGFIHTCLMGCYVGAPTYLVSPVDFAANPLSLFLALARYKIKDTYATSQMLDYAMGSMAVKGFQLHELKNLMVSTDGRPRPDVYQKVRLHFASAGLDRTAINTIYSHVLNPMIASRSYMCIEPIELWLDTKLLRQGYVYPVDGDNPSNTLLVQDSGMVPVSTQIAIVNPETCCLSHVGEYGEIWVQSEACAKAFYMSKQEFDRERFRGKIFDGDPGAVYVRTGDLGFLHTVTRPIGPGGQPVEMQVLFVLGGIGETFEVNGLNHFPVDIEMTIEKCHRNIIKGGSAVFQAGGLTVALVEVTRKAYLASMVPVIVNSVLNEHQVVIDIVAFVPRGDFPRSRLGEKQRGKILASWITRKLRTIAQFSIRDSNGHETKLGESASQRASKTGSLIEGSLRHSTAFPEADDYAVQGPLYPVRAAGSKGTGSEEFAEHYPVSHEGISSGQSDPTLPSSHGSMDKAEQYQTFNPSDYDVSHMSRTQTLPHHGRDVASKDSLEPKMADLPDPLRMNNSTSSFSGAPTRAPPPALNLPSDPSRQASESPSYGDGYDPNRRSEHQAPQPPVTNPAVTAYSKPLAPLQGRNSLPSQQARYSNTPQLQYNPSHGPPGSQRNYTSDQIYSDNYDNDWPEEAISYQTRNP
ncbi:putative NRPS-like protein biosynthetic cluster [Myotisia sp. PD_48]|nr:putative NRPS-like protein biosynthetic cluster [Myotisia sp. PD_48]